jgi:hypothetical protein
MQGLRRFTTKPSAYLVEPQNQDQMLDGRRLDQDALISFDVGGHTAGGRGLRQRCDRPMKISKSWPYCHEGCVSVNTKNWYREETDLWAEFGRRTPFGKRFSSKHLIKTPAVGSTSSFGRRAVSHLEEGAFGNAWWRRLNIKKGRIDDGARRTLTPGH